MSRWIIAIALLASMTSMAGCKNKGKEATREGFPDEVIEPEADPEHVAIFLLDYAGTLVPLACYDDVAKRFRSESDCLELIPTENAKARLGVCRPRGFSCV